MFLCYLVLDCIEDSPKYRQVNDQRQLGERALLLPFFRFYEGFSWSKLGRANGLLT